MWVGFIGKPRCRKRGARWQCILNTRSKSKQASKLHKQNKTRFASRSLVVAEALGEFVSLVAVRGLGPSAAAGVWWCATTPPTATSPGSCSRRPYPGPSQSSFSAAVTE